MTQSRIYTAQEAQDLVIDTVAQIADEYAEDSDLSSRDKCHGVAFSILAAFDGTRTGMPALDLVIRTDAGDADRAQQQGENYFQDGTVINAERNLHTRYDQLRSDMTDNIAKDDDGGPDEVDVVDPLEDVIPF